MATQLYATDRNGLLYILDPTNFTFPSWAPGPLNIPTIFGVNAGPALYGLAFDSSTNGIYFAGLPNGVNSALYGIQPNVAQQQSTTVIGGTPSERFDYNLLCFPTPTTAFQPDSIIVDAANSRLFIADPLIGLSVRSTVNDNTVHRDDDSGTGFLDQLSGSPYYPGVGPIQAQGLAYDSNLNHVYTCCQTATGDALAVYNTATAPMTLIGTVPLTLSLASSGCSIALDTANNHILITCAGGLWVVNATSLEPIQSTPFSTDGSDPRGLVVANGKVFVCNFGSDTLAVLNSSTLAASSSPLTTGHSPRNVAYNSTTGLIYVTNFNGNPGGLSVFNASTLAPQTPTGLMNLSNLSFTNLVVGP